MKNETIIKIMEKFVDSGWCLEPDGINRMPEKPEETEFYHILSSFLEPRCKEDFSKKEKHRLELIEYLLEGKKIIRKTADSADQKEPEYWALQWNGKAIESVGFARLVYPGWQMFLDFLSNPTPWTVDAADIAWEPDLPTNILQSGGVMNDRESFGFKPGEQVEAQKLEKLSNWIKATAEPVGNMKTYKLGYLDKDSEIYGIVDEIETVENFR